MRHIILALILPLSISSAEEPVLSPVKLLTEGGEKLWDNTTEFTVRFPVHAVQSVPTIDAQGLRRSALHLVSSEYFIGKGHFSVPLSPNVEATLKRIGIKDVKKHFTGKTITVRGKVSQVALDIYGSPTIWTHHIQIESLDQILNLESPKAKAD